MAALMREHGLKPDDVASVRARLAAERDVARLHIFAISLLDSS